MAEPVAALRPAPTIRRLLVGYLLVMGLLGGGFAIGSVLLVRAADRDRAAALIETDIAETLDKLGSVPAMRRERARAIVLARTALGGDRLYRLMIEGEAPAGLDPGVRFVREGAWLESSDPPALARVVTVAPGARLLVGRRLVQGQLTRRLTLVGTAVFGIAMLLAVLVGLLASRELRRRVDALNDACDRVRAGDFAARAPVDPAGDEFAVLGAHVNAMLERIDTLVTGLRDVSNRIAHDLRTPVARLKTSIEQAAAAQALPEARTLAGAAAAETDEILQTFEALLDIAEVEAGSTEGLSPIRLDEAVASALDLYESVAEASGVALESALIPVVILGEKMLVVRLAANLIDNAIKFSAAAEGGGRVGVAVTVHGDEATLSVRDNGPGIPGEERERVLGRFQRGRATQQVAGHGLGLALVNAVAKRHGARLAIADSGPGLAVSVTFDTFGQPARTAPKA